MLRHMLNAKLHQATVTDCHLEYEGSLTVDEDLLDRVGMVVGEKIQVVNINNGARFETYLIPGERGSGQICVNGAAARLAQPRDRVIIIAYALLDEGEMAGHKPTVLRLNERNEVVAEAK